MTLFAAKAPLQFVSIDVLGELIRSNEGYRNLRVITDRFSKFVRAVPLKRIIAPVIAQAFIKHWVYVYGPPEVLLSDNGKQFVAKFFQNVCRILGIRNVFTTTYHPQCNGQVERYNRTLLAALLHYIADQPKEWEIYTDTLGYAYNTQVQTSTKAAPFDLVISRSPPSLPMRFDEFEEAKPTPAKNRLRWRNDLKFRTEQAARELVKTQARYKRNSDARRPRQLSDLRVMEFTDDTVVLKTGEDVERLSLHRVETAPENPETQEAEKDNTVYLQERELPVESDDPPLVAHGADAARDLPLRGSTVASIGNSSKNLNRPRGKSQHSGTTTVPEDRKDIFKISLIRSGPEAAAVPQ
ncbi:unnamed protein product [Agarophyton chilense]